MRVIVTRNSGNDIDIWVGDDPSQLIWFDYNYFPKLSPNDFDYYQEGRWNTDVKQFKKFFGFTPRKRSKKVYVLTLDELQK